MATPLETTRGPRLSPGFRHAVACILLATLTAGTFSNALVNEFVDFDDWHLIETNAGIRSLSPQNVERLLFYTNRDTWLPLRILSYAVDYHVWGLNAFGYHLTNLALHVANVLLVYAFLVWLLKRPLLAWLGAAWFAVHPVQVASVTWASGRRDVLYAFFFLLSLLLFLQARARKGRFWVVRGTLRRRSAACWVAAAYAASALLFRLLFDAGPLARLLCVVPLVLAMVCHVALWLVLQQPLRVVHWRVGADWWLWAASVLAFALSLLSKASGMMLPVLLLLILVVFESGSLRERVWACVPHGVVGVALVVIHVLVAEDKGVVKTLALGSRLASMPMIFASYWRLLFFPINLATPHAMAPVTWGEWRSIAGCAVAVVAVAALVWVSTPRRTFALFCLGWWFMVFLPVSHLVPLSMLVAERYMYMPMVGACAFGASVVGMLAKGRWRRFVVVPCAVAVLGLFVCATHARNRVWLNSLTFWRDGVSKWPAAPVPRIGMASMYIERGQPMRAWRQYQTVTEPGGLAASGMVSHLNLVRWGILLCYDQVGRRYEAQGRLEEARKAYQKAAKEFPERVNIQVRLAQIYHRHGLRDSFRGQLDRAVKLYDEKLQKSTTDPDVKAELDSLHRKHPWVKKWLDEHRRTPSAPPAEPPPPEAR